ncbi:MAG: host-nuclease inhibitor Gam family protein [Dysgonomonas sp.]|uniref:host-nuclease inhibitor Gam family protein n=1 Tax=Dysgonomonas sp. TaxID=1891233 RepID=UPI003A867491
MAKREKKTVITGVTSEAADRAFAEFATADARIAKINADMDVQFTNIRDKYAGELAQLEMDKSKAFDTLQVYATENKDVLFPKKKSVDTVHGTFGFRTGNPKLKTLKGFTWNAVASVLEKLAPDYIRKTIEADKEKLLADRDIIGEEMKDYGVAVVQEETFYVERKSEDSES